MKVTLTDEKALRGYATVARIKKAEVALWHENMAGLQSAFEKLTGKTFHPALAQPVALYNLTKHEKK
jgi:mannosyltransferase OCH1-like enzyme